MKNSIFYILMISMGILYNSCKPTREMTYLRDVNNGDSLNNVPPAPEIYKIKAADNLYVTVITMNKDINDLFNPEYNSFQGGTDHNYGTLATQYINGYIVDLNGEITLPILGKIRVENKTINEATAIVQKAAADFVKDASVKIRLLNYKITVLGEVKTPGVYYNYDNNFTVLDAVAEANGDSDFSKIKRVKVLRRTDSGSITYVLDFRNRKFLSSPAYYVQPSDVIYVDPANLKSFKVEANIYALILSGLSSLAIILKYM